jgi:hypothetical protein
MSTEPISGISWEAMRREALRFANEITNGREQFNLKIGIAASYDNLLEESFTDVEAEESLAGRVLNSGRTIISAEAGSGKTWLLARLMSEAARSDDVVPFWISFQALSTLDIAVEVKGVYAAIRRLLSVAHPDPRPILASAGMAPKILLLVDGINEASRAFAELAIDALDEFAFRYPFASVVVTDRLVRRPISLDKWTLASVLPLSDGEVHRVWLEAGEGQELPSELGLLKRPFFLNTALVDDIAASGGAESLSAYFTYRIGLNEIESLSLAAFDAYSTYRSRVFSLSWLRSRVADQTIEKLIEAGALRDDGDRAWFSHHLLHDFLAANALSTMPENWTPHAFGVITLDASSFDALRLTAEQVSEPGHCDELIRAIYDWNYFGAAYALADHVPLETRITILAMLADKRWDPIVGTVAMVTDALRLDGSDVGRRFLAATSPEELYREVKTFGSSNSRFIEWRDLFVTPVGTDADARTVERIRGADSVIGWTLANVLRRCDIDPDGMQQLVRISSQGSAVERWRSVHVLGAHPTEMAASALFDRLSDEDSWVRYGAIRSVVEVAARTAQPTLRNYILGRLTEAVQRRGLDNRMTGELAKALNVRPQPEYWAPVIAPLIQQLVGASETLTGQRKWTQVMDAIAQVSDEVK